MFLKIRKISGASLPLLHWSDTSSIMYEARWIKSHTIAARRSFRMRLSVMLNRSPKSWVMFANASPNCLCTPSVSNTSPMDDAQEGWRQRASHRLALVLVFMSPRTCYVFALLQDYFCMLYLIINACFYETGLLISVGQFQTVISVVIAWCVALQPGSIAILAEHFHQKPIFLVC